MRLLQQGRKYALTAIFLALSTGLLVASYVLALRERLTGEFVTIASMILGGWTAATIGFQVTNTVSGNKAIEHGIAPAPPPPETG